MVYDEDLADRLRVALQDVGDVTEKKMFGGLAFMVGGHMAVGPSGQGGLLVRCDPAETDEHASSDGVSRMVMRGKEMNGWLRVEDVVVTTDLQLLHWVDVGVGYASALPPKG